MQYGSVISPKWESFATERVAAALLTGPGGRRPSKYPRLGMSNRKNGTN